jgi:prevent-host-death family protein
MTEVGIETLRQRLADFLARAEQGERIVITEGGRAIALLSPLAESESAKRAWKLVETGAARWSGGKPEGARPRPRARGMSAAAIVLEDRR